MTQEQMIQDECEKPDAYENGYKAGLSDGKKIRPGQIDLMASRFYEAMLTLVSLGGIFTDSTEKAIAWATETAKQTDDAESVAMKKIIAALQKLVKDNLEDQKG
jgi:hypothetical protein